MAASTLSIRLRWGKLVRRHVTLVELDLDDAQQVARLRLVAEDGGQRRGVGR